MSNAYVKVCFYYNNRIIVKSKSSVCVVYIDKTVNESLRTFKQTFVDWWWAHELWPKVEWWFRTYVVKILCECD